MHADSALAVVVVCPDSAGEAGATLMALGAQLRPGDEVVVVDNASRDGTPEVVRAAAPQATVVESKENLGFAGGCHVGARASRAPLVLLLNPDAVPAPGCLDALRACAAERPEWGAWQALVTMAGGELVNTAGNVVHYLGFGWAGQLGRSVATVDIRPHEVGFCSGAALVVRRDAWDDVGGFDERYFMYGEDLDLSLRLRLAGWGVGIAPAARVAHDYEFTKGDYKWFYLERNRWWTLVGDYPARLLALLAPGLLAFEVALLGAAWRGGWLRAKLRAQAAVLRALPAMLRRRRAVQATRRIAPRAFAAPLAASLDSPYLEGAARVPGVDAVQRLYWRAVRAVLG
jgi:N-acetylglucosaminyl-diphospho-decaprenol L-rhamnosyltransferase